MDKALRGLSGLILMVIVAMIAALGWLIYRLAERTVQVIDRTWGDVFYQLGAGASLLAFVVLTVGGSLCIVRLLARRSRYIHARDGMFPVADLGHGHFHNPNEQGAQTLAAMAGAGKRATAAMAGRVIDAHYERATAAPAAVIEQPAAQTTPITVRDVVGSVEPRTSPHWLLVGATGSGKTSATYSILDEMARRAPCQFQITEPGGVNWGSQAVATRTGEIADMIIETRREMERRQELLRAEDVDHIEDLSDPPQYLVLVTEEMDAVLDELKLTDQRRRTETLVALRAIARMGRKPGVCLVAVSQSGTTDVFDAHVRKNLSNVLLFRSEHTVNEMWRLSGVRLNELPVGMAYSVRHAAMVQFPHVRRPALTEPQPLRREGPIGVSNWPRSAPVEPVVAGSSPVVERLQPGREPSPQLAAQLRKLYAAGWSKTALCNAAWGYKDGVVWSLLERVLAGEL